MGDSFYSLFIVFIFVCLYIFTIYLQTFLHLRKIIQNINVILLLYRLVVYLEDQMCLMNVSQQSSSTVKEETNKVNKNISHSSKTNKTTSSTTCIITSSSDTKNTLWKF